MPLMHRLLPFLILAATTIAEPLDVWPGWRGSANGVSALRTLPSSWSTERGIAWKVDVPGRGHFGELACFSPPISKAK
jgi:hypothetical protein